MAYKINVYSSTTDSTKSFDLDDILNKLEELETKNTIINTAYDSGHFIDIFSADKKYCIISLSFQINNKIYDTGYFDIKVMGSDNIYSSVLDTVYLRNNVPGSINLEIHISSIVNSCSAVVDYTVNNNSTLSHYQKIINFSAAHTMTIFYTNMKVCGLLLK